MCGEATQLTVLSSDSLLCFNTPVRDKSHNAQRYPLGEENVLHWAINQQLVISTSYSRLASYKWGNSWRQEPLGKQDVKISDGRLHSPSRLQLVRVFESSVTESQSQPQASRSVIVYCQRWCTAGFKYKLQVRVLLWFPVIAGLSFSSIQSVKQHNHLQMKTILSSHHLQYFRMCSFPLHLMSHHF